MKCIGSANRNSVDVTGHFSDEIVMNLTNKIILPMIITV
jgi:hypothetical protein